MEGVASRGWPGSRRVGRPEERERDTGGGGGGEVEMGGG